MGFTTVPDKKNGDVFTESMWDTFIRDNLNYLNQQGIYGLKNKSADVGVSAPTAESTAIPWITMDSITFDGVTTVELEWFCPGTDNSNALEVYLFENGVSIGLLGSTGPNGHPLGGRRKLTPPAGPVVYELRAGIPTGSSGRTLRGGNGGPAAFQQSYARITYGPGF